MRKFERWSNLDMGEHFFSESDNGTSLEKYDIWSTVDLMKKKLVEETESALSGQE